MMFQSYALFPHMTVEKNVAFGLEQEGLSRAEVSRRSARYSRSSSWVAMASASRTSSPAASASGWLWRARW